MNRTRILFIGEAITLSHIARPFVLANTLSPERYEVIFACDKRYRALLGPLPFEMVPLHSRLADKSLEDVALLREELYDLPTIQTYIEEDLRLFSQYRPDVVVGDMRQSLIVSSRLKGIPFINIQSCHWHPWSDTVYDSPVSVFSPFLAPPIASSLHNLLLTAMSPFATLNVNLACLRYGLPPLGPDFKQILSYGNYIVFPDIPEWSSLPAIPPNAAYVGPLLWSPSVSRPEWWEELSSEAPAIYIGLGSSGQVKLLRTIIGVISQFPVKIIVSTASRRDLSDLPSNVYVASYLDGAEAARRSCLVICNGGSTAGPQALKEGVPILGITSNCDQSAFMRRIEMTGAGHAIPESLLTESLLESWVAEMLNNEKYRMAARKMAKAMSQLDTGQAFLSVLRRAVKQPTSTMATAYA